MLNGGFEVVQDALRHLHERIRFHKGFIHGPMGRMLRSTEGEEVFRGGELISVGATVPLTNCFLILLRHERGVTLVACRSIWQHGHRSRLLARATVSLRRMVAMESGRWRSGRVGGVVGSSTTGNGLGRVDIPTSFSR